MDQLAHTNYARVETTSLLIITEGYKQFAVAQHFGCSGAHLENTTSQPTVIHSNQSTNTIYIGGNVDWKISLGSLQSHTEVQSGGFGNINNDGIGINPPRTSGGIIPQVGDFNIFKPIRGTSDFTKIRVQWHGAAISEIENPGGDVIFKNSGRDNNFEIEKFGRKNYEILNRVNSNHTNIDLNHANQNNFGSNHTDMIPTNLPNNDLTDFFALQQILS